MHKNNTSRKRPSSDISNIDYKNPELLMKLLNDSGKIVPRVISGFSAKKQRVLAKAVKRARALGLIPYVKRGF